MFHIEYDVDYRPNVTRNIKLFSTIIKSKEAMKEDRLVEEIVK